MDEHIENNIQTAISKTPSPKTAKSFGSLLRRLGDRIPMHFETMQNPSLSRGWCVCVCWALSHNSRAALSFWVSLTDPPLSG